MTNLDKSIRDLELRDLLEMNEFKESDAALAGEIGEIDDLYGLAKRLLLEEAGEPEKADGRPARMGTNSASKRKNMKFISDQIANLISIRSQKISLIKQRADLKKNTLDRFVKTVGEIAKVNKGEGGDDDPSKLIDLLVNQLNISINTSGPMKLAPKEIKDIDAELDALLDGADDADELTFEEVPAVEARKKIKREYDAEGNLLVYDASEERVYLVNPDYDLIREVGEDEYSGEMDEDGNFFDSLTYTLIEVLE